MAVLTLGARWESGSASTFNPSLEFQSCLCGESQKTGGPLKVAGANMVQLEHLKALLSSLDPIILTQLLVEILKE
tara:strand:- start:1109 stop:1333 length:225 start_codon:yes stop_codon:yes gene_type:complete